MKNFIQSFLVFIIILPAHLMAQNSTKLNILGIIDAEFAFAKLAEDSCTRTAFLTYLADDAITFGGG